MNQDKAKGKAARSPRPAPQEAAGAQAPDAHDAAQAGKRPKPEWASGLRQLYDSVVNEPLPDSFADLISRLDDSTK